MPEWVVPVCGVGGGILACAALKVGGWALGLLLIVVGLGVLYTLVRYQPWKQ